VALKCAGGLQGLACLGFRHPDTVEGLRQFFGCCGFKFASKQLLVLYGAGKGLNIHSLFCGLHVVSSSGLM
jgi:hypothetical protein